MNGKTTSLSAASRGTVPLGNRLGFGAMRITGEGIWGPPKDRAGAIAANAARKGEIPVQAVVTLHNQLQLRWRPYEKPYGRSGKNRIHWLG